MNIGKCSAETLQFRVLGFRADCTMQAGPAPEYAEERVTKAKWPVAWVRRQIGEVAASKFVSSRTAPKALFRCEVHRDKALLSMGCKHPLISECLDHRKKLINL